MMQKIKIIVGVAVALLSFGVVYFSVHMSESRKIEKVNFKPPVSLNANEIGKYIE